MTKEMTQWVTDREAEFRETERERDEVAEYQSAAYARGYANAMRDLLSQFGEDSGK